MSYITRTKSAAPATPGTGKVTQYTDTEGRDHILDATGVDNVLPARQLDNLVRNSGFWFTQRQVPGTLTTYSNVSGRSFPADGWGLTNETASAQYRRVDTQASYETGMASRFYGEFTKITAAGKLIVTQVIEAADCQRLRGRTVRLTAKMKRVVGAAPVIRMGLLQLGSSGTVDTIPATFVAVYGANGTDPTMGSALTRLTPNAVTGDNCTVNGDGADCTLSSSWQRFSLCFDLPTSYKNLIVAFWSNAQIAATNGFALGEVQLTDGYELQDFSALAAAAELARVQRYYAKTFAIDTAPAASVAAGRVSTMLGKAGATALAAIWQWQYPVPMRGTPTVTTYNPGAAGAQGRQITGTAADLTVTTVSNQSERAVEVTATGAAASAVGDQAAIHLTADAEM